MSVHQDLWIPPDVGEELVLPVGQWWDAVSAEDMVGDRALHLLGHASGAVIQDDTHGHGRLYWLVEVGTARSWCLRHTRVLTTLADESTFLTVPPVSWTAGHSLYWRVPVGPGRYLTDAQRLHEALSQAISEGRVQAPEGGQWVGEWETCRGPGGAS